MIKYEAENVRFWVDQDTGALAVETDMSKTTYIPFHDAGKIIALLRQDRTIFEEKVKEENSTWNRLWQKIR
jgi:transcription initiation factor IIE alpha subunit